MKSEKKCKGTGKALGHGCGKTLSKVCFGKSNFQYGLGKSCGCFKSWTTKTKEGREWAASQGLKNVNAINRQNRKEEKERFNQMKIDVYGKENRQLLDKEVQKLARMIDKHHGIKKCIDCGIHFGKQVDGGHFTSKGSNTSLRWNLHNIHSQASHCNRNGLGGGKQLGYYEGLQNNYSKEYADYVRFDLVRMYPSIKLSNKEVHERLTLVRKINRDFNTFLLKDPIKDRTTFNNLIGIYTCSEK